MAEYDDLSLDDLPAGFRELFDKQRRRIDELESFIETEHAPILDQLRELREEVDLTRTENETLQLEVQSVTVEFSDRMEELSGMNEMLEMANDELQSQVDTLSGALEAQQKAMAAAVSAASSGGSGVPKSPRSGSSSVSGKGSGKKKGKKKKGASGSRSPESPDLDGVGAPHLGIALSDEVSELRMRLEEMSSQSKQDAEMIESLNNELAESRKDNEDLAEVCEELRLELEDKEWEANDAVEAAKLIKEDLDDTRQYLHKRMESLSRLKDEVAEIKEQKTIDQNKASAVMSRSRADTRKVLFPLKNVSSATTTPTRGAEDETKFAEIGDAPTTITISTERQLSTGVGGRYRTVSAVDLIIGDMSAADLAAELAVPPSPSPGTSSLISGSATPVSPQPLAGGSASDTINKGTSGGSSESERRDSVDSFDGAEAGRRGSVVYAGADDWFGAGDESPTMDYETSVFNLSDTELPDTGRGRRPSIVPPTSITEDVGLVRSRLDSDLALDEDFVSKDIMDAEMDTLKESYEKKISKLKNKHLEKVKKLKKEHKQALKKKQKEAQKKMKLVVDKEQKRIRGEIKQWMDTEYKTELAEMQKTQKTLKTERLLTKYTTSSADLSNTLSAGSLSVISDVGTVTDKSPAGKGGKRGKQSELPSASSKRAARDMALAKRRLKRRKDKMARAKKDATILGRFNGFSKYKNAALGSGIAAPWLFKIDVL